MDFATKCREMIDKGVCRGDCCGLLSFPASFIKENRDKIQREYSTYPIKDEVYLITTDGFCIFLDATLRCAIYHLRPPVCRDYGLTHTLPCPYLKSSGNARSVAGRRHTERVINHSVDEKLLKVLGGRRKG